MNLYPRSDGPKPYFSLIAVVIIVLPVIYSLATFAFGLGSGSSGEPFLEMPASEEEACQKETPYMRYQHMDYLKELRDAGVRGGARREVSLADCRRCHVSRERFCDRCHEAVNLTPDCFECHYYP
jgi:hypothetical protein